MSNYIILTKILLKNGGSPIRLRQGKAKGKAISVLIGLLLAFSLGSVMVTLYAAFNNVYDIFSGAGQTHLMAESLLNAISFVVFFFALLSTPSIFYFSQDVESLLPLPLKPEEIIIAKFIVSLVYEYFIVFLFLAPLYAVLIQHTNPFLFTVNGVIVFLLTPVLPLIYATVVVMLLMSFSRFSKNKDHFNMVIGILGVCVGLGINLVFQKGAQLNSTELFDALAVSGSTLKMLNLFFPTNIFYAYALTDSRFYMLLISFAILTIALFLFTFASKHFYFKGVIGIGDVGKTSKKVTAEGFARQTKSRHILLSYIRKEVVLLVKNPVTFLNCISTTAILPIIIVIMTISSPELIVEAKKIAWNNPSVQAGFFIVCGCTGILTGMLNSIAPTAITREGKHVFFMKYIPVSYRIQIHAKAFSGILMGTVSFVLLLSIAFVIIGFPLFLLSNGLVLGIAGTVAINYLGLLLDLAHPNLSWDNEQQAVKQSLNVLLVMLVGFVMLILLGVLGFLFLKEPVTAWLVSFLTLSGCGLLACQITANKAAELMARLENE